MPDLVAVNRRLAERTGFRGVPVEGYLAPPEFFARLAQDEFPIGNFIRDARDLGYTPAPDVFHDLYGHLPFLADGMTVSVELYEGKPLSVQLPETVVMKIVEADPVVKGQTASSSYKPAVLENGVRTLVPPFMAAGELIVVNTADGSYRERAKK